MRIVPIIKTVGVACNLKCTYCWFNPLDQTKVHLMSPELLDRLIAGYASVDDSKKYQFIWHGGEPLMAGRQFFETAIELQKKHMADSVVKNVIQTNGTMLNEKWVEFLLKNRFKVGVSLDGPKQYHDTYRLTPSGAGSHDTIMRNLVSARAQGLKFSVIATVNHANVGRAKEMFDFFRSNDITSFGFNMVYERDQEGKPMPYSVSNEEYLAFQNEIFDEWLRADDPRIRIRHIDNILAGMMALPVKSCIYAGSCERFINISSNGDVYPCERLVDANRLGNLNTESLPAILSGEPYKCHSANVSRLHEDCLSCEYVKICRNGCSHHRVEGKLYFCEARKGVFRHIEDSLSRLADSSYSPQLQH